MGLIMLFPNARRKAFTTSYDDNVVQDIRLVSLMRKHGIKGTFNINSGCIAASDNLTGSGRMSENQMKLCYGDDMEVAVHTVTHPTLTWLSDAMVTREVLCDKEYIEKTFGKITRGMAYPNGNFSDKVVKCLEASGIAYSRTVISTRDFGIPEDWLRLRPTCHHNDSQLFELGQKFVDTDFSKQYPFSSKLFYLWGHSYEFDLDNNWERIEKFFELIGGREDIWYATNIEIYDYIKAYESLIFSADGSLCHNPTCITLWLSDGKKNYEVTPGNTIEFAYR